MISENVQEILDELAHTGNYGNSLDDSVPPSTSSTPPTRPQYDGEHYYFIPWGSSKPCLMFESQWEDVTFRLEALNFMLRIRDRLVIS